jgi:hypothetical protein
MRRCYIAISDDCQLAKDEGKTKTKESQLQRASRLWADGTSALHTKLQRASRSILSCSVLTLMRL